MQKLLLRLITVFIFILLSQLLISCHAWEYNVYRAGMDFDKLRQESNGTYIGFMRESRPIQGFPCEKGWIHFNADWTLQSFQLSKDYEYNETLLPAHTWLHFRNDDTGNYVCSFPSDYNVQGKLCGGSGGYKGIHTGFYASGKLRSFYPPSDVLVDGVPCKSSLLVNVKLHENGKIKSCKLSADFTRNGILYEKGDIIKLDEKGNVLNK